MDTDGVVYAKVPAGGPAALEATIREVRKKHETPLGVLAFDPAAHAFALVDRWGRSDDMPHWAEDPDLLRAVELAALSKVAGEVVAYYGIDEGDTFAVLGAWRDGALVRELQWAEDGWQRVTGEPQPWEAPLFGEELRERALEDARDAERDEEPVRAIFAAGRIEQGAPLPVPRAMGRHLREVLRAPAHGFQPWPRRRDVVRKLRESK